MQTKLSKIEIPSLSKGLRVTSYRGRVRLLRDVYPLTKPFQESVLQTRTIFFNAGKMLAMNNAIKKYLRFFLKRMARISRNAMHQLLQRHFNYSTSGNLKK